MMFYFSRAALCVFLAFLAAPMSFGKKTERKTAEVTLLGSNSYICNNCFFGTSDYYYCFDTGDKTLIGYQKIPAMSWNDHNTNLLTRVRKSYVPWQSEPGTNKIKLTYDDKMIWVTGANGKEVKLRQNYQTDIFLHNAQYREAIHKTDTDQLDQN